jgi:hypothetical protein
MLVGYIDSPVGAETGYGQVGRDVGIALAAAVPVRSIS